MVVSINMSLVPSKVVTLLRSLVMVLMLILKLTIGSVPTVGTPIGEKKVSSELRKEILTLTLMSGSVNTLESPSSLNEDPTY